jgi:predicted RecA/RadA family phage recombinase
MKNFLQKGEIVTVPAPADVSSGDFVTVGGFAGVAQMDAASGDDVAIVRTGIFTLPKATGAAWAKGDPLYWAAGTSKFTTVASGNLPAGVAAEAAESADTEGAVALVPAGSALRTVAGQATTVTASDTVVTGLSQLVAVVATLDSDPGDDPMLVSASIGDQAGSPDAGSFLLKTWKNTSGTDPTPAAASTFSKRVNWIAYGY